MENRDKPDAEERVQLHLVLPYKLEPREHHRVRNYLDLGYRIVQLQRVSDQEVVITLKSGSAQA